MAKKQNFKNFYYLLIGLVIALSLSAVFYLLYSAYNQIKNASQEPDYQQSFQIFDFEQKFIEDIFQIDEQNFQLEPVSWHQYSKKGFDLAFDKPSTWLVKAEQQIIEKEHILLGFNIPELSRLEKGQRHFLINGYSRDYQDSIVGRDPDSCPLNYRSVEEFCLDGCFKVNKNLAYKYQYYDFEDIRFKLIAYTDLSKKYPSTCFELTLDQLINNLAQKNRINASRVSQQFDIVQLIEDEEVNPVVLQVIDDFKQLIKTIEYQKPEQSQVQNWPAEGTFKAYDQDDLIEFKSLNKNISFQYPAQWYVNSLRQDSWYLSNWDVSQAPGRGGLPDGAVKIFFEIADNQEELNLEQIFDCRDGNKVEFCTQVLINGRKYQKKIEASEVEGRHKSISYAVLLDNQKILYIIGIAPDGSNQLDAVSAVESIVQSIEIK